MIQNRKQRSFDKKNEYYKGGEMKVRLWCDSSKAADRLYQEPAAIFEGDYIIGATDIRLEISTLINTVTK
jgi:hypothetical protein